MTDQPNMILVILGANAVVYLIRALIKRWIPLGYFSLNGIYVMLLPLAAGCMGVEMPIAFLASSVLLGLGFLLGGIRNKLSECN